MPAEIRNIRIAPIWSTQQSYDSAVKHRNDVTKSLKLDVLEPFLKTGGLPSYIEKGEMLIICNREFFVNDCYPRDGLVGLATQIEIEIGFTKEVF